MLAISLPAVLAFWFRGSHEDRGRGREQNRTTPGRVTQEPRRTLFTLRDTVLPGVRAHDEEAFREVWRVAGPHMLRYASVFVDSPSAAEDVVQDVMVLLWKQGETLSPRGTLAEWLLASVRNVARGARRNAGIAERAIERAAYELAHSDSSVVAPTDDIETDDTVRAVRLRLATLTEHQRLAIQLRYYYGYTIPQVAETLGISPKGAERLMTRILAALRRSPPVVDRL